MLWVAALLMVVHVVKFFSYKLWKLNDVIINTLTLISRLCFSFFMLLKEGLGGHSTTRGSTLIMFQLCSNRVSQWEHEQHVMIYTCSSASVALIFVATQLHGTSSRSLVLIIFRLFAVLCDILVHQFVLKRDSDATLGVVLFTTPVWLSAEWRPWCMDNNLKRFWWAMFYSAGGMKLSVSGKENNTIGG